MSTRYEYVSGDRRSYIKDGYWYTLFPSGLEVRQEIATSRDMVMVREIERLRKQNTVLYLSIDAISADLMRHA